MEKQGGKYQIDHWNVQQGTGKAANRTGKVLQRCQRALRRLPKCLVPNRLVNDLPCRAFQRGGFTKRSEIGEFGDECAFYALLGGVFSPNDFEQLP